MIIKIVHQFQIPSIKFKFSSWYSKKVHQIQIMFMIYEASSPNYNAVHKIWIKLTKYKNIWANSSHVKDIQILHQIRILLMIFEKIQRIQILFMKIKFSSQYSKIVHQIQISFMILKNNSLNSNLFHTQSNYVHKIYISRN